MSELKCVYKTEKNVEFDDKRFNENKYGEHELLKLLDRLSSQYPEKYGI